MRFTIVAALAALAYAQDDAADVLAQAGAAIDDAIAGAGLTAEQQALAANSISCLAWLGTTGTAKVAAGTWAADGKDEDGLTKYKLVSDNSEVTDAMWKAETGYAESGCAEVEAAEVAADAAEKAAADKKAADAEAADGAAYLAAGAVMAAATALAF